MTAWTSRIDGEIARAAGARDPSRLVFLDAVAFVHGGVYVAHGHELDAANRFATQHAPFGRDAAGRCRLQIELGRGVRRPLLHSDTHSVGGFTKKLRDGGYYANTGSWVSVASVADLKAKGITFDTLSIADRASFPSKMTAVVIEYDEDEPLPPVVVNAR